MWRMGLVGMGGVWNLPKPGVEPVSLALADRFLSTVLPGKSCKLFKFFIFEIVVVASFLSRVRLFAAPRTVARQALLSMGFSRQE